MKNIIKSLVIIVTVGSVASMATYAYFSDTQTAAGNTMAAGTLKLTTNDASGVTMPYHFDHLKPGSWDLTGQVMLKNVGTVDGHAWLEIQNVVNSGNNSGKLADFVVPSFQWNVEPWTRINSTTDSMSAQTGKRIDIGDINAGESLPLVMYAVWPTTYGDADNTVQGNSVQFDVVFHLDQKHP